MKIAFVRSALVLALPVILVLAFVRTLYREIKSAFWHARQEVRIELESFKSIWKSPNA